MNTSIYKKIGILLFYTWLLVFACACSKHGVDSFPEIPKDIMALYTSYMEAAMDSTQAAEPYRYFVNEGERTAYNADAYKLKSYQLVQAEKLSDVLYVFTSDIDSTLGEAEVYYFAAWFEEQWNFVMNINAVPEEARENIDVAQYSYGEDSLPYDCVIIG